eukprot:GHVN01067380.1.p1 GENE.GHVN01067380.1~~GHVN01067380.1.p1  ORF type:complete len:737 (+),score=122.00 GHVN01067380.1:4919-7129(+)
MAQPFVMGSPLVHGHGNFGSLDNDPPAAMRYTECKLTAMSDDVMLRDVKQNCVDFIPNFDGNEKEPVVLPARLPLLLANGGSGIAVGMATNIPPHNVGEVVDATIAMIRNPNITLSELMTLLPAPDFPTGGVIVGAEGAGDLYSEGKGTIRLRAKYHIEGKKRDSSKQSIVITEFPYSSNKAGIVNRIAQLIQEQSLDGAKGVRDESDRDGTRVVIELTSRAFPGAVIHVLMKTGLLQHMVKANMVAVVDDGQTPAQLNLKRILRIWIDFRLLTVRRRKMHELSVCSNKVHLLTGLNKAGDCIDKVIAIVKKSPSTAEAKEALQREKALKLTSLQASAVLSMTIARLNRLEKERLQKEIEALNQRIDTLKGEVASDSLLFDAIADELHQIKGSHHTARRTLIVPKEEDEESDWSTQASLGKKCSILLTRDGYAMKVPFIQANETRQRLISSGESIVTAIGGCRESDTLFFLFADGRGMCLPASKISTSTASQRLKRGLLLPGSSKDGYKMQGSKAIAIGESQRDDPHLFLLSISKKGWINKIHLSTLFKKSPGRLVVKLQRGDSPAAVVVCRDDETLGFAADRLCFIPCREIPLTMPNATRGAKLKRSSLNDKKNFTAAFVIPSPSPPLSQAPKSSVSLLVVSEQKDPLNNKIHLMWKRVAIDPEGRGALLNKRMSDNTNVIHAQTCTADGDVVMITDKGTLLRKPVSSAPFKVSGTGTTHLFLSSPHFHHFKHSL